MLSLVLAGPPVSPSLVAAARGQARAQARAVIRSFASKISFLVKKGEALQKGRAAVAPGPLSETGLNNLLLISPFPQ